MNKSKQIIKNILQALSDTIVPTLPIMIGAGMIKVLLIILGPTVFNILPENSSTYIVFSFVADAGYYFLPIFVAISAAEVFNTNKYLAGLVGAMLVSPTFIEIVNKGQELNFLGLPIALTHYDSQVIPSIFAIWMMSTIYSLLDLHIPKSIKSIFVPLITLLIMIPISFCLIGPLGVALGEAFVTFALWLKDVGPIGSAIICALSPIVVAAGLGSTYLTAMLLLASTGCDPIFFFNSVLYNSLLGFVLLPVYLKDKNAETLASAVSATIAGTSEPAVFSVLIKDPKAFLATLISSFVAGLLSGILQIKSYAMASFGVFGVVTTIAPDTPLIKSLIVLIIACSLAFVLSFILHKKHE